MKQTQSISSIGLTSCYFFIFSFSSKQNDVILVMGRNSIFDDISGVSISRHVVSFNIEMSMHYNKRAYRSITLSNLRLLVKPED